MVDWECTCCGRIFPSSGSCLEHLDITHPNTKGVTCFCNRVTEEVPTVCTKCAICPYCQRAQCATEYTCEKALLEANRKLDRHYAECLVLHPPELCVKCPYCDEEFCATHLGEAERLRDQHMEICHERPPPEEKLYALRCHYWNILGLPKEKIQGAVENIVVPLANPFVYALGYDYVEVNAFSGYASQWKMGYFDIVYRSKGSPAIPVLAILGALTPAIVGAVVFWVAWVYLKTQEMEYESKKSLDDLLQEGYIDEDTYEKLREGEEEDWLEKLMDMLPLLMVVLIISAVAGALPKGRRN